MIFADKLIKLRKKNGWSQEELADKMNVSRQAVSKWESAQSVPDLEKILQLGNLFGVTTDYLLKDEIEDEEFTDSTEPIIKRLSLTDANEYLSWREKAAKYISFATMLCIFSPIILIFLASWSEIGTINIPENLAVGIGMAVLLMLVAFAVSLYVYCGFKNTPYEFLEKVPFEMEYGVAGMVKEKQKAFRDTYVKSNIIATCMCILSPLPLILAAFAKVELYVIIGLCITLIVVAFGVRLYISAGVQWAAMDRILREANLSTAVRQRKKFKDSVESIYWIIALAIYLGWSFITNDWHITWVVWPVAGILSAVLDLVLNLTDKE